MRSVVEDREGQNEDDVILFVPRTAFDETRPREQAVRQGGGGPDVGGPCLSNREIAESLHLSETTVKRHLSNVYEKMGVRSRGRGGEEGALGRLDLRLGRLQGRLASSTNVTAERGAEDDCIIGPFIRRTLGVDMP